MHLFEYLTETDKTMIEEYINTYAYTDGDKYNPQTKAPLSTILRCWSGNKEKLFNIFGQKFILERHVELNTSTGEIAKEFEKEFNRKGSPFNKFFEELKNLVIAGDYDCLGNSQQPYRRPLLRLMYDDYALVENTYNDIRFDIPTPDGKMITFEQGCKLMHMLGKIAKAYNMKTFDEFRIWHSQKLNSRKHKGTLCLSIHPLDFMTMSDNDCNWTSCMSWSDQGCYRSGTVECMNSKYVIVAYLKSDNGDMEMPVGTWNSKKWRSLFIVHDKVVTGIKGYPYRSDELNTEVLNWLREILPNGKDYGETLKYNYNGRGIAPLEASEYDDPIYDLEFITSGHMYNDFGSEVHMGMFVENEMPKYKKQRDYGHVLTIDYSGPFVCMHCGSINDAPDDETELMCVDCSYDSVCECCECHLARGESYNVGGHILCYDCYLEETSLCPVTENRCYNEGMTELYLVPDDVSVSNFTCRSDWLNAGIVSIKIDENVFESCDLICDYGNLFKIKNFPYFTYWWNTCYYVTPSMLTEQGLNIFVEAVEDEYDNMEQYLKETSKTIREINL